MPPGHAATAGGFGVGVAHKAVAVQSGVQAKRVRHRCRFDLHEHVKEALGRFRLRIFGDSIGLGESRRRGHRSRDTDHEAGGDGGEAAAGSRKRKRQRQRWRSAGSSDESGSDQAAGDDADAPWLSGARFASRCLAADDLHSQDAILCLEGASPNI